MKKKILICVLVLVIVGCAVAFPFVRYMADSKDTEELYRNNVSSVKYENTIETAIPQTELYNMIKEHFESPLADGTTDVKQAVDTPEISTEAQVTEESTTKKPYAEPTETTTIGLPYIKEIKIEQMPLKTTYCVGEDFSEEGIVVNGYFNNNIVEDVTESVSLYYTDTSTPGKKKISVEYVDEFTNLAVTSFYITVIEPETTETDITE